MHIFKKTRSIYSKISSRRGTSQLLTIKRLVSPMMTLLHSFLPCEMVLLSRETVVCIFNGIFPGCELVSTIAENQKNALLLAIVYREILMVILIIYMHFVCIQNILSYIIGFMTSNNGN